MNSAAVDTAEATTGPTAPTVVSQTTNDTTPTITGTFDDSDSTLTSVEVNGVTYTVGTDLSVSGGTWTLTIPADDAITTDGTYAVTVTAMPGHGDL